MGGGVNRSNTIREYVTKANKMQESEQELLKECTKQVKKLQLVKQYLKHDKIKEHKQFNNINEDITDLELRLTRIKETLEKERVHERLEIKQELWLISVDVIALKGKLHVLIREEATV